MFIHAVGYAGKNIGDLAYKIIFPKLFPKYRFLFNQSATLHNIGSLCGGNIGFSSYTKQIQHCASKYALSISVNSKSDFESLKTYKQIIVRDYQSQKLLAQNNIRSSYAPDFTLALQPNSQNGHTLLSRLFSENGAFLHKKVVCVITNSYLLYSESHGRPLRDELKFQNFCVGLAEIADNTDASFIFLPFSTDYHYDDRISSSWAYHFTKWSKKNTVIYNPLSVQETLDLISISNATISARLHGLIFSFLGNVPMLDIQHDTKTTGFLETINQPSASISYNSFDWRLCKEKLDNILNNQELRVKLSKELIKQRQLLQTAVQNVHFSPK